jgi:hypothetical protein
MSQNEFIYNKPIVSKVRNINFQNESNVKLDRTRKYFFWNNKNELGRKE